MAITNVSVFAVTGEPHFGQEVKCSPYIRQSLVGETRLLHEQRVHLKCFGAGGIGMMSPFVCGIYHDDYKSYAKIKFKYNQ